MIDTPDKRYIDVSHTVEDGMLTYLDSPFHRFADGKDLSELPLDCLADLEGVVVRLANVANGFRFFAVPVKVKSFGTFPVRAFAIQG
jgi:kynurenine formamidase